MGWSTKLKEKAEEHTISGLFALIVLLSLIVWGAVPSEVWDRVSEVTPKRALWALTGLQLIAAILASAYIYNLRKQRKKIQAENVRLQDLIDNPPRVFRFGVYWDKDLIPYCPSCLKPLTNYGNWQYGGWGFNCVSCKDTVRMHNDEGRVLELAEAKRLLSSKDPSTELRAIDTPSPDKTKLRQALGDLESLRQNLQNSDVEERIVILYHAVIERLKNETGYDLTGFSIPPSEIDYHKTHHPRTPNLGSRRGSPAHTTYSKVRYCNRQVFRTAIDSAINRLKLELSPH